MKKLLPLLLIAALLCGCAEREQTPSLTTTTTTTTTSATTTTPQATTTTTAENTPTDNLYIGKMFERWYKDIMSHLYPVKGQEDPEERVIIDTLEEDGCNIHLVGCNVTREEDYSFAYYDGFMLVSENGNTIAGTELPYEKKEYKIAIGSQSRYDPRTILECYEMVKDGTVHKLYAVHVGVIDEGIETYFLVYDDGGFRYINEEPIILTGGLVCYEDECKIFEAEKNRYYIFDFENHTYRTEDEETVELIEYKPDYEPSTKSKIDFLSDDQYEVFAKSRYIKSFGISASNSGLSDYITSIQTSLAYGLLTNVSYDSFMDFIRSAFTEEDADATISKNSFMDVGGRVCWLEGERGTAIDFAGEEFVLISKDDSSIKFKCVAYYEGESGYSRTDEIELEMVKTEDGWRMKNYNLWY